MPSKKLDASDILISPLTFLQVMQSSKVVMNAMLEQDTALRHWVGQPGLGRAAAQWTTLPLYYHLFTSGYTATVDNKMVGWVYVRGRQQILYVEALATHPDWRRQGIGRALLRFAESLAQELNRQWLGLNVTPGNTPAVRMHEQQGFKRGHWRTMAIANPIEMPAAIPAVQLKPLYWIAAEQTYQRFAAADIGADGGWDMDAELRMIPYDLHRQWGHGWLIEADGRPAGYVSQRSDTENCFVYVACEPEWWNKPEITAASLRTIPDRKRGKNIVVRFGSSAHHEAARNALLNRGFEERAAETAPMFKLVSHGPSMPYTPSESDPL